MRASALLKSKRLELDRLAQALVDYETLDRDEIELVIKGKEEGEYTKWKRFY